MALRGSRYEVIQDITFFMAETGARGGCVCLKTAGSGAALDQSEAEVEYATDPSGMAPIGILLCDVVNYDLTRQKLNPYKEEVQLGSKVVVLRDGWVVTNMIASGVNPAGGEVAYVTANGELTNTLGTGGNVAIGEWLSSEDEDGFAKVYVKVPRG